MTILWSGMVWLSFLFFSLRKIYTDISHYNNDFKISCQVQHLVVLWPIFFVPCIEKSDIKSQAKKKSICKHWSSGKHPKWKLGPSDAHMLLQGFLFCQCKSHSKLQKSKKISVFAHFSAFTFICPYTLSQNLDGFSKKLAQNVYQIVIKLFQAAFFNTIFFDKVFFFGPVQQKIVKWKFETILM